MEHLSVLRRSKPTVGLLFRGSLQSFFLYLDVLRLVVVESINVQHFFVIALGTFFVEISLRLVEHIINIGFRRLRSEESSRLLDKKRVLLIVEVVATHQDTAVLALVDLLLVNLKLAVR